MRTHIFFSLPFLLLLCSRAGALFGLGLLRCQFTSLDDSVYVEQYYFNKKLLLQYNSTLRKFTGYTEKARDVADGLNKSPAIMESEKKNEEKCKSHLPLVFDVLFKTVEPTVRLRSVDIAGSKHPGMLVCSGYGFYPKQIRLTWQRNGKNVTSDVTSTEELPNGSWLYQIHSYLEFTPRPGDKITCMVEHASLTQPKLYEWDPALESQRNKIAVGTAGLLLGLVFLITGLIYYKKNNDGEQQDEINQKRTGIKLFRPTVLVTEAKRLCRYKEALSKHSKTINRTFCFRCHCNIAEGQLIDIPALMDFCHKRFIISSSLSMKVNFQRLSEFMWNL